jgi:aminopeptidase N
MVMSSLTRDEAVTRAELLSVHDYDLDLDLTAATTAGEFDSTTRIRFACRRPGAETFVELKPATLREVTLNGEALDPAGLVDNRLPLVGLAAENELVVRASMSYSNTGEGLHRFTDPEDGSVYLYAQSFLDDAQRMFACFDQPDLKAPVTLTVSAPPEWEVAANGAGTRTGPGRWRFETTPPLATYFVSLIAGPYHVRRDEHDGIPLGIYCRRGLAADLDKDADEIFGVTKACLDYYHDLFNIRYPFGKYDQAFVPEFNEGAMENAGLVTFRDDYVFRSAVADDDRELRAMTISHEMAHMWFGDLVTMRWWDDLWLNESFAEYLGHRVVAEATRFRQAWTGFAVARKSWGYAADQRPSTHPIAPESLEDSALALLNFDGISYAKGAATLRQLVAWLGEDTFAAGLRGHFAAHAFGNASLSDLLDALSTASGRDLSTWAEVWLRRAQVNTLRPEVVVADGRYASVDVVQTAPPDYPTLRPHRIGIGVYSGGSVRHRVEVSLDPEVDGGRTPVPELAGVPAGDLLLLNDGDLTFAKIRFDEASQAALAQTLPRLTDSLSRALVWAAVADMVRDAEAPATLFVDLCAAALPSETEVTVLKDVMGFATVRAEAAAFAFTGMVDRFLPPEQHGPARATLATAFRSAMDAAPPASGVQLLASRGYVAAAGPEEVGRLRGWLAGSGVPAGLEMDADSRWAVLAQLAILGEIGSREIDAEYEADHTAQGAERAARTRALLPDPATKAEAWHQIMNDDSLSNRLITAVADGFWHPRHSDLTNSYVERFFGEAPAMARRRSAAIVYGVALRAYPRFAVTPETVTASERMLAEPDLNPTLRRVVVDHTDELRRALAGRTRAAL